MSKIVEINDNTTTGVWMYSNLLEVEGTFYGVSTNCFYVEDEALDARVVANIGNKTYIQIIEEEMPLKLGEDDIIYNPSAFYVDGKGLLENLLINRSVASSIRCTRDGDEWVPVVDDKYKSKDGYYDMVWVNVEGILAWVFYPHWLEVTRIEL